MSFNMYVPTRVLFGAGQLNNLNSQRMPGKKAIIVTSSGKSAKATGYLARTEEQLRLAGVETVVFDKVQPNPLKSTVMAGGAFGRENGCGHGDQRWRPLGLNIYSRINQGAAAAYS